LSVHVCPNDWNREPAEDRVVGGDPDQLGGHDLVVADEVGVGQFGALRLAGGTRAVEDHRGVLVVALDHLVGRLRGREYPRILPDRHRS
jgi:hypothetical protein